MGDEHFALFRVAAMTGMRRGEVCGLRWSDIELENGVVEVRRLGHASVAFTLDKYGHLMPKADAGAADAGAANAVAALVDGPAK